MDPIITNDIVIRPFDGHDIRQFVVAARESGETLGAWMPWWKDGYSENDAREWFASCSKAIATEENYDIGVFLPDGISLVGGVSINGIDQRNKIGNIGYWVRESLQNKGYCSKAVTAMAQFGFETLGLVRLEVIILLENAASRRVAEKCGAKLECLAENRLFHKGVPMPAAVYSLLQP